MQNQSKCELLLTLKCKLLLIIDSSKQYTCWLSQVHIFISKSTVFKWLVQEKMCLLSLHYVALLEVPCTHVGMKSYRHCVELIQESRNYKEIFIAYGCRSWYCTDIILLPVIINNELHFNLWIMNNWWIFVIPQWFRSSGRNSKSWS